ncbi:MAG: hypothetical protein J5817_09985, partial [Treponema sp.]|nr:hypothetical protein [Treponema sp.]
MDKDFVKMFLLSGILFVCGVMMIETPITCWKEFSLMAKICMPIFGLLFLIPAFIIFTVTFGEYKKKYNLEKNNRLQVDKGGLPANDLFGKFRKDYADFLLTESGKENPEVQNDVTQMFRNIIDLRAKRLKSMNIQCKFESIRTNHTSLPPLQRENFSDGKYKIQSVREDVIASTSFLKDKDT